jgi:hypothetical protein
LQRGSALKIVRQQQKCQLILCTLMDKDDNELKQKAIQWLTAVDDWQTGELSIRVRRPDTVLFGETQLDPLGLERLAEHADNL